MEKWEQQFEEVVKNALAKAKPRYPPPPCGQRYKAKDHPILEGACFEVDCTGDNFMESALAWLYENGLYPKWLPPFPQVWNMLREDVEGPPPKWKRLFEVLMAWAQESLPPDDVLIAAFMLGCHYNTYVTRTGLAKMLKDRQILLLERGRNESTKKGQRKGTAKRKKRMA